MVACLVVASQGSLSSPGSPQDAPASCRVPIAMLVLASWLSQTHGPPPATLAKPVGAGAGGEGGDGRETEERPKKRQRKGKEPAAAAEKGKKKKEKAPKTKVGCVDCAVRLAGSG